MDRSLMPTLSAPRHGVSLAVALKEAAITARADTVVLHAFEFYHPVGTPDGPIYVVADKVALTAKKEAGADRDAGLAVYFIPLSVSVQRPEESDTASAPEITLVVGNVSGLMSDALRSARGSLEPWVIIERVYVSTDLTGPAIDPPLQLYVTGVDIEVETVSLRASFGDSANVSVPRVTFKRSQYPGLVR